MSSEYSLKSRLVKSFLGVASLRFASIPLSLAASVLVARLLGPEAYGQYAFIIALIPLVSLPLAAGVPQLLTREIAGYTQQGSWGLHNGIMRASLLWVLLAFLLIWAGYLFLDNATDAFTSGEKWTLLPLAVPIVLLTGLRAVGIGVLRGMKAPTLASLPEMLVQPLCFLLILGAFHIWFQIDRETALTSYLLSVLFSLVAVTVFVWLKQAREVAGARPEFDSLRWLRALLPFSLLYIATTVNMHIGTVLLGFLANDTDVAAMRVASTGAQFIGLPLQLVNIVISPYIVESWRKHDAAGLQNLSTQSARGAFAMALPVALVLIFYGRGIISVVFGDDYATIAATPLAILAVGQLVNVFFGSVGIILSMTGHETFTLRGQILAMLSSIGLSLLLIPHFGAVGCAIGISCGYLVWNVFLAIVVFRRLGIRPSILGRQATHQQEVNR